MCQILNPKPKRHFIKSNIEIPIDGGKKKLDYGGWVEVEHSDLMTYLNYRNVMKRFASQDSWQANSQASKTLMGRQFF